ncbi:hypothetical protein DFH08DRAFT_1012132 [Mycena albidolilacea]|uniref:Uncharacterized protein n=1 Tax=Mycena albidolilacea TaxID=1033008 RepID=A0AAD7EPC0_9AGAR|nr:hypothetical protein DFH08DRAFT_1012132 [Mycena albidolilacea]
MHSLCLFQSFGVTRLLEHVLMPNLRIFKLRRHRIQSGGVDTLLSLNNFLGVSTKLHTLDLFLNCMTQDCLLESLPALASITHLTITGFSMRNEPVANNSLPLTVFDDNILRLLTETSGSGSAVHRLCPLLQSIRMKQVETISWAALLAFIQSRMASGSALFRVDVTILRPKHLDILPSLRSYLSAGLQLSLHYVDAQRYVAPTCGEVLPTTGFSSIIGTGPGLSVVL